MIHTVEGVGTGGLTEASTGPTIRTDPPRHLGGVVVTTVTKTMKKATTRLAPTVEVRAGRHMKIGELVSGFLRAKKLSWRDYLRI